MPDDFDPTPHVRPPMIDIPSGVALGVGLLAAVPKPRPEHVDKAAKKLRKSVVELQAAWAKSDAGVVLADKRRADIRIGTLRHRRGRHGGRRSRRARGRAQSPAPDRRLAYIGDEPVDIARVIPRAPLPDLRQLLVERIGTAVDGAPF